MEIYPVSEGEILETYKLSRTEPEKIEKDVKELKEWIKTQPHLPQTMQFEDFFERALAHSFYRVELAKTRIEQHFTYKGKNKDFYELFGSDKFVLPSQNYMNFAPLPKLGPKTERIYVGRLKSHDAEKYDFAHTIQVTIGNLEMAFCHEKVNRNRFVIDCDGFGAEFLKKFDVSKFIRLITLVYEGYMTKIIAVHLLNVNSSIQFLLNLSKKIIPGKALEKINIHDSFESLHEVLPPEYLPREFGGTCGDFSNILEKMDDFMEKNKKQLVDCINYVADETKRLNGEYNGSTFGVDIFF